MKKNVLTTLTTPKNPDKSRHIERAVLSLTLFGVSATSLFVGNSAQALTFQTFTDRATWQAAVGAATSTENFNSFLVDTEFGGASVTTGALTLTSNADSSSEALVEIPPYTTSGATGIDNTPMVNSFALDTGENIEVQLPSSFSAFGFDYESYDFSSEGLDVFVGSDLVTSIPGSFGETGFIGFIATDGSFDTVEFRAGTTSDGVFNAFDNVEWGNATTPEPSTLLGLLAVSSLGALTSKRK